MIKKDLQSKGNISERKDTINVILSQYDVEYPSELEIMATINVMRSYMPKESKKWYILLFEKVVCLLQRSFHEFANISAYYWIANILFFLFGALAVYLSNLNPYFVTMLIAPIPFILGLTEIFKSRDKGLAELESTLKYTWQEIVLSKLLVIGFYNFILNILFTSIVPFFLKEVWPWKMILYWVTPFMIISAVSFIFACKVRSAYVVTISILLWLPFCIWVNQSVIKEKLEQLPVMFYIFLIIIAALLLFRQTLLIMKRDVSYDFNY